MSLLARVAGTLETKRTPFAVVGGVALAVRGVARSTFDVDLMTTDAAVLTDPYWFLLSRDGAQVEIRRGDGDDPLRGLVRLVSRDERPVDVFVGRGAWLEGVLKRAEPFALLDVRVPVVRAADLVLLKLHAGGTQDLWDVKQLLDADGSGDLAFEVEPRLAEVPRNAAIAWKRVRAA
jgi:predicted nucleotidyltransferase